MNAPLSLRVHPAIAGGRRAAEAGRRSNIYMYIYIYRERERDLLCHRCVPRSLRVHPAIAGDRPAAVAGRRSPRWAARESWAECSCGTSSARTCGVPKDWNSGLLLVPRSKLGLVYRRGTVGHLPGLTSWAECSCGTSSARTCGAPKDWNSGLLLVPRSN